MNPRNILTRRPFDLLGEDFNRLLPTRWPRLFEDFDEDYSALAEWKPAVDVRETDTEYFVKADIPGVESKDLDITLDGNMLTITGTRKAEREEGNGYRRVERFEGSFFRRIALPNVDEKADVSAKVDKGVLTIHLPKLKAKVGHKIPIKA